MVSPVVCGRPPHICCQSPTPRLGQPTQPRSQPPPTQRPSGTQPRGTCQFPTFIPLAHSLDFQHLWTFANLGTGQYKHGQQSNQTGLTRKGAWEKNILKKSETTKEGPERPEVLPKRSTSKSNQRAPKKHQKVQSETTKGAPQRYSYDAAVLLRGMVLGGIDAHFAWQFSYLATSTLALHLVTLGWLWWRAWSL